MSIYILQTVFTNTVFVFIFLIGECVYKGNIYRYRFKFGVTQKHTRVLGSVVVYWVKSIRARTERSLVSDVR